MLHEALQMIHNNQVNQTRIQRQNTAKEAKKMQLSTQNMTRSAPQLKTLAFGSSITVHKLRESKWFGYSEIKILLSVVESGFILEKRNSPDTNDHQWGIALWEPGQEKSKNINHIKIYTLSGEKDKIKVTVQKLDKFWSPDNEIRINNQHDKEKPPNTEEDIRKQAEYAVRNKSQKWHNNEHFPYFCRYEKPIQGRIQQISDRVRWNSIGVNLGMILRGRNRRPTASN